VISFAVDPRARRKKIGTLLFQRLFLEARKPLKITVELDNYESALFLKSLGFDPPKISTDGDYLIFKEKNPERLLV
jgi:GNAT superfamily N-acetyltransferase